MRIVVLTTLRPHTYHFLAHLISRGVVVERVVFQGSMSPGIRATMLGWIESLFLWLEHVTFLRGHPRTEILQHRRYGSVTSLLKTNGIGWTTVANHNDEQSLATVRDAQPDILILSGTRIIKEPMLAIPRVGTLNMHSSILPKFRGGKSEFWILFEGDPASFGITVHWVVPAVDAGPIVLQERIPVCPDDTPKTLRAKAQHMAPVLLAEALRRLEAGEELKKEQPPVAVPAYRSPNAEQRAAYQAKFPGKLL